MVDLKEFRESNGLLQKELAAYLGVSVAFISAIEKGQSKLPGEKLVKLLDNDKGWNTDSLVSQSPRLRPYYDMKTMNGGQDFGGGQFNAPIYCGKSDEDIDRIVKLNLAEYEAENRALRVKVQDMARENAFLRSMLNRLTEVKDKNGIIPDPIYIEAGLDEQPRQEEIIENIHNIQK